MRYINTLREGETIRNIYLCKGKRSAETRNGKPYDNLILQDKTGTLDGKVWDPNSGGIADYDEKDFIEVYGDIISYNNNLQMNIKQIRKAGEGEYTISMGGVTVMFGVKGDVLYCTTDAVVKSALDGADIESLASMSKIFKGQSGSFYVDFEGVNALTAQLVGGNVDPQVEAALSVLAMFEDLEAYGTMKGGTAVVNMTDKEQNSFKTICDKIGELIRLYVPEANL